MEWSLRNIWQNINPNHECYRNSYKSLKIFLSYKFFALLLNDAVVPEFVVDELALFIDSSGHNKMKVFLGISQWLLLGFFVQKVMETNLNFSCQKVRNQKK